MRVLLHLIVAVSVAVAVVITRDDGSIGNEVTGKNLNSGTDTQHIHTVPHTYKSTVKSSIRREDIYDDNMVDVSTDPKNTAVSVEDGTGATKGLSQGSVAGHDDHRLTEIFLEPGWTGKPIAWATQLDAEREYCIKVKFPEKTIPRSIRQYQDLPLELNTWFVCYYYDDDHCNDTWNPSGVFPMFYLQRNESSSDLRLPILSMKCNYADPGGWQKKALFNDAPDWVKVDSLKKSDGMDLVQRLRMIL